jgi:hypothetical protein
MQIIENVARYDWWPYRAADSGKASNVSSLRLPVEPAEEPGLLLELAAAWSELQWLAVGTWHRRQRGLPAQGFAARYPGLAREIIARCDSEGPRGFVSHSEWCVADPSSYRIHDVLSVFRKSRGKGGCLTLGSPSASRRSWYTLSMAAVWRSVLAIELEGPDGFDDLHAAIVAQYLTSIMKEELVAMIPLDFHPMGGYVILGGDEQVSMMANLLPPALPSFSAASVAGLFAHGGGLAL